MYDDPPHDRHEPDATRNGNRCASSGPWIKYRCGLVEHFWLLSTRDYAVFSAILLLQKRHGPHAGRVGTRRAIVKKLGKRGTVYRAIESLVHLNYLEIRGGIVWVLNPNGGDSKVRKAGNCL